MKGLEKFVSGSGQTLFPYITSEGSKVLSPHLNISRHSVNIRHYDVFNGDLSNRLRRL